MLHKSKEQFDSGGTFFDYKIFIGFDEKLENEQDVDVFVSEQMTSLKFRLMLMLGYTLDGEKWVKQ